MTLSLFLAKVFGMYLAIVCAAFFLRRKDIPVILDEFERSKLLAIVSGAMALLLGLALVVLHNVWEMNWRVLITLLGWISIVKGCARLFFLEQVHSFARRLVLSPWHSVIMAVFFFMGLYLTFVGFAQ